MKRGFSMLVLLPFLVAAKGQACAGGPGNGGSGGFGGGSSGSGSQITPDVSGEWSLSWEDNLGVEITIGGAVYEETLGALGGIIHISHDGQPITFNLDCSLELVVCPSEVWPDTATLEQRDEDFPRNVYVTVPVTECTGELVAPDPSECGPGTPNEGCDDVCDGEVVVTTSNDAFGRINFANDQLNVLLAGDAVTNGYNCALLGLSVARADFRTEGSPANNDWRAVSMPHGEVIIGVAGGCLWPGDENDDGTVEALVIGASIKLTTSFTAERQ